MAYCTRADIESVFGLSNVSTWADLENKQSPQLITARINDAIGYAESFINMYLGSGPYTTPFTTVSTIVKRLAATLAGLWLYESRGVLEYNPETGGVMHRYHWHKKAAMNELRNIKLGGLRLGHPYIATFAPEVVVVEETAETVRSWEDGIELT